MKRYLYQLATDQRNGVLDIVVKMGLLLLSWMYRILIQLRLFLYEKGLLKANLLSTPVISIGNITWGGVGKTPMVIMISEALKKEGKKVVILTRGYMEKESVSKTSGSDEALMMEKMLRGVPVFVGANRYINAREYLKDNTADVFLLDDGFAHLSLKRDLNIVAIDATNPWGNGQMIPRGILREPLSSLKRADVIVITKTNFGMGNVDLIKSCIAKVNSQCPVAEALHQAQDFMDLRTEEIYELPYVKETSLVLVSSIGDPQSFEKSINVLHAKVVNHFIYPDHYCLRSEDFSEIVDYCRSKNIVTIVTTEKDAVKITKYISQNLRDISILALRIKCELSRGKDVFLERVFNTIHS